MMDVSLFIGKRLRFKGNIAMASIAVSFLVMIIAVSVSSGFRCAIRSGLAELSGDIRIMPPSLSVMDESRPIEKNAAYRPYVEDVDGVKSIRPVVYKAGIVKSGENIQGVLFKGVPSDDTLSLSVSIPRRLSEISGLGPGDRMLTYFVGETVKVRQFSVASVYDAVVETDDRLVVYADIEDLQRLNGWDEGSVSCLEVMLEEGLRNETDIEAVNDEIGTYINAWSSEDEEFVVSVSSVSSYPQLFDWLDLIDFNVFVILVLMTIVAGFNMISGLLIMLFENISTIGLLKAIGMTDRAISKVFLSSSAFLVFKGMAVGNLLAVLFCVIQDKTGLLRLDPENYFVSSVPVDLDLGMVLTADAISFVVIMILLLIPCLFISKVDPADTVRVK
ncbi:MAG: ABC transporter permease [Bacteroidales bacterium]|nr:ABC transporter permease [Bacteroidales bacterium]